MYIISAYIASDILTPLLAASNGDLVRTSVRFVNKTYFLFKKCKFNDFYVEILTNIN